MGKALRESGLDHDQVFITTKSLPRAEDPVRGVPVISKSVHPDRIEENPGVSDFRLSGEAMSRLDALDQTGGTARALEHKWW